MAIYTSFRGGMGPIPRSPHRPMITSGGDGVSTGFARPTAVGVGSTGGVQAARFLDRSTLDLIGIMTGADGNLRPYQGEWMESILTQLGEGKDRGYLRAPYQTGKTRLIGPLAHIVGTRVFPGKKVLVITPFRIITQEILSDLESFPGFPQSVGVIQGARRDFSGAHRIVVASAHTLGRDEHLARINPDEYGLVIIDEATFGLADTWKKILTRFGFLDADRNITHSRGKYLLGLTADPFSLLDIFGQGALIKAPGLAWFMQKGHLHRVSGLHVPYKAARATAMLQDGSERIVTLRDTTVFAHDVVETYRQHLGGKRTLVHVATIAQANAVEAAFRKAYGYAFATAVHSETTDDETDWATRNYSDDNDPLTVLISIWKLAYGYRARGTEAQLFTYDSSSLRRTGQRIGRGLGLFDDEPQRDVRCLFMRTRSVEHQIVNPAALPRLFGIFEQVEDGIVYHPLQKIARQRGGTQSGKPAVRVISGGSSIFSYTRGTESDVVVMPHRFLDHLVGHLRTTFRYDILEMSDALGMQLDDLDRLLYGELPKDLETVHALAVSLGIAPEALEADWYDDALQMVEQLYPMRRGSSTAERNFVLMVRRAVLAAGAGTIRGAVPAAMNQGRNATRLTKCFKGTVPRGHHILRALVEIAITSGTIARPAAEEIMQRVENSRGMRPARQQREPKLKPSNEDLDEAEVDWDGNPGFTGISSCAALYEPSEPDAQRYEDEGRAMPRGASPGAYGAGIMVNLWGPRGAGENGSAGGGSHFVGRLRKVTRDHARIRWPYFSFLSMARSDVRAQVAWSPLEEKFLEGRLEDAPRWDALIAALRRVSLRLEALGHLKRDPIIVPQSWPEALTLLKGLGLLAAMGIRHDDFVAHEDWAGRQDDQQARVRARREILIDRIVAYVDRGSFRHLPGSARTRRMLQFWCRQLAQARFNMDAFVP
jgi:superfamily II DNA or RNA helicase